ncbi:phosphoribosyltransferase family protein [Pedococcus sp. KACC 23699]|uniref:Phosphoribosyltransferase family protein n=1 Tax=Pedococcus sp. KACC 23699 TaxID=3149228 RepID=A0AAU7JTZ6_9MICO
MTSTQPAVPSTTVFADRAEAGRRLSHRLGWLRGQDVVVLGLPRGGVPVAFEVATALGLPLDVIVVRKLGLPFQPELAMGAVGEGGYRVLDTELVRRAQVTPRELDSVERHARRVLQDQVTRFRRGRPPVDLTGRTVVIVDDGVATGATARVAAQVARHLGAGRVLLGVPVAPAQVADGLEGFDQVVCLATPQPLVAVGVHYRDFSPTSDDEVVVLLDTARRRARDRSPGPGPDCDLEVVVPVGGPGGLGLGGHLHLPEAPAGIVVFAHGSGSSRHSPRNQFVASVLHEAGMGTLLMDLLAVTEEGVRSRVFDIDLLAQRLLVARRWVAGRPEAAGVAVGFFGASTGAAAALVAAATPGSQVAAVVSRGGRPDLAAGRLRDVRAPTLLIVGGEDHEVLELNRQALGELRCSRQLSVVPGATHLFEEPGTLAEAALLARDWFVHHLDRGDGEVQEGSTP